MTATEAPEFSSALVDASTRLAAAGRRLRRDPRIDKVFEGVDFDEGPERTTFSSYLDILPRDGSTVSWLLDGTLSGRHWNLEGSIRKDPDGNGQRVVTRFAVREGDEPQAFSSALRNATRALIRSATTSDVVTPAGTRPGTRTAQSNRVDMATSPSATGAELAEFSVSVRDTARSPRQGPRNAMAPKEKGTIKNGTIGNRGSRQREAISVADPDLANNTARSEEVHHRPERRSYTVTFEQVKIVQAGDLMDALKKVQLPADAEVLSVVELM
jgi:hypothetical protein